LTDSSPNSNPKILHRIYFDNFAPYYDPWEHYLETWRREMPDYRIMKWNKANLDIHENEWVATAWERKSPVFLSEYFRWKVLSEYGGLYLDADCEILNGQILKPIVSELYEQDEYDVFFGVEEYANGHPTAQTVGARPGAELVRFMMSLYQNSLAPLWHWREKRGLIGPQLMALYFLKNGVNVEDDGFFKNLTEPVLACRAKVYPQTYFSPKFSLLGETIDFDSSKTCIYHMFANSNMNFTGKRKMEEARKMALSFDEYRKFLEQASAFPRKFDLSSFSLKFSEITDEGIESKNVNGVIFYGPYITLPMGRYIAKLKLATRPRKGDLEISVTENCGEHALGHVQAVWNKIPTDELAVTFEVAGKAAYDVEIVTRGHNIDHIVIESVEISTASAQKLKRLPTKQPVEISIASAQKLKRLPTKPHMRLLHRIYFGFDGKPDAFAKYLQTWKGQLPNFEIVHWDASNLPMDINPYVRTLYAEKDHTFLSDYFRWYVLREYGGTYLDADVEITNGRIYRQLIDEIENAPQIEAFIGIDEKSGGWYTAHTVASKPGSKLSRFMCDLYENFGSFTVWRKKGFYFWAPQLVALYFANQGHNKDQMGASPSLEAPIVAAGVKIYPQDWFSPLSPTGNRRQPFKLNGLSKNTCLCHHFACSWHAPDSPYLEYSRTKGGQANVLLSEIISSGRKEIQLAANDLSIGVGRLIDGSIAAMGVEGCLSYGPYITLAPGSYLITYHLASCHNASDVRVDVAADRADTVIARGTISQQEIVNNSFAFPFSIKAETKHVEFRVFVGKRTNLQLSGMTVSLLEESSVPVLRQNLRRRWSGIGRWR